MMGQSSSFALGNGQGAPLSAIGPEESERPLSLDFVDFRGAGLLLARLKVW
jgi:hypothetical protein